MTLKSDSKFEEKQSYGLENDTRNLVNVYQNTQESQNWGFDKILFSKKLFIMTINNDAKSKEELTCRFKIDTTI